MKVIPSFLFYFNNKQHINRNPNVLKKKKTSNYIYRSSVSHIIKKYNKKCFLLQNY